MAWDLDSLVTTDEEIAFEHALLKDPDNLSLWLRYYRSLDEADDIGAQNKLGDINKRLYILNRAISILPRSYKLWSIYLDLRVDIIHHYRHTSDQLEGVNALFLRALNWLNKFPIIWTKYLQFLMDTQISAVTTIRRTFNRSLVELPTSQHHLVWKLYLEFADRVGGLTGARIYKNFLKFELPVDLQANDESNQFDVDIIEIIGKLVEYGDIETSWYVFKDVWSNYDKQYIRMGVSKVDFLLTYLDNLVTHASETTSSFTDSLFNSLADEGLENFHDQISKIYIKKKQYYVKRRVHFTKVRYIYDKALKECITVRDFVLIFDSYVEFEEGLIESLVEETGGEETPDLLLRITYLENLIESRPILLNDLLLKQDVNNLDEWFKRISIYESQNDINKVLTTFAQALTTINPLKCHSVSSNNAQYTLPKLWIKYANIYASSGDFQTASIVLSKAVQSQFSSPDALVELYIQWSELATKGGDFDRAQEIIEEACTYVPGTGSDDDSTNISDIKYNDASIPIHKRLHKSIELWTYYIDLLESAVEEGTEQEINRVSEAYDKLILLKIVTPLNIINYAMFLEDWSYFERAFTVYELGTKLFQFPVSFEIWNIYLAKAVNPERKLDIERVRDLFEQCLSSITTATPIIKPVLLLYSEFEEKNGLILKSIKILQNGIQSFHGEVSKENASSKSELYSVLLAKLYKLNELTLLRSTFESILEDVSLSSTQVLSFSLRFVDLEVEHHQFLRVRQLFKFSASLKPPQDVQEVWDKWENFELTHGDENSFKDMLRFKRSLHAEYQQEITSRKSVVPTGFVKAKVSNAIPKPVSSTNVEEKEEKDEAIENPDEIDIDMD